MTVKYIRLTDGFYSGSPGAHTKLGTMPQGLRPPTDVRQYMCSYNGIELVLFVGVDGNVGFTNVGTTGGVISSTHWGATITYGAGL